jgi:hypothetical protein
VTIYMCVIARIYQNEFHNGVVNCQIISRPCLSCNDGFLSKKKKKKKTKKFWSKNITNKNKKKKKKKKKKKIAIAAYYLLDSFWSGHREIENLHEK